MKMSDVFALPVRRVGNTLADEGGYADGEDEADSAVHAINQHDRLVEALCWLLSNTKKSISGRPVKDMDEAISYVEGILKEEKESDAPR